MTDTLQTPDETDNAENDNFNVVAEVPLAEWVEQSPPSVGEYVHVVVGKGELRLYRTVNDDYPTERAKTTVENTRFREKYDSPEEANITPGEDRVESLYLTGSQARNLIEGMRLLVHVRDTDVPLNVLWYENNSAPVYEEIDVKFEYLFFRYSNFADRREFAVHKSYRSKDNLMAKFGDSE